MYILNLSDTLSRIVIVGRISFSGTKRIKLRKKILFNDTIVIVMNHYLTLY